MKLLWHEHARGRALTWVEDGKIMPDILGLIYNCTSEHKHHLTFRGAAKSFIDGTWRKALSDL